MWFVERNNDTTGRRRFPTERLAQKYAELMDRIHEDEEPCTIVMAPVIEMIDETKPLTQPDNKAIIISIHRRDIGSFLLLTIGVIIAWGLASFVGSPSINDASQPGQSGDDVVHAR